MSALVFESLKLSRYLVAVCFAIIPPAVVVLVGGTPYMLVAGMAYGTLSAGIWLRRNRPVHATLMNFGILLDVSLVLTLQIERDAVGTALSNTLGAWEMSHIICSTLALVLYFPLLYLGWSLFRNRAGLGWALTHRRLGVVAFVLRSLGFVLMFSMLKH